MKYQRSNSKYQNYMQCHPKPRLWRDKLRTRFFFVASLLRMTFCVAFIFVFLTLNLSVVNAQTPSNWQNNATGLRTTSNTDRKTAGLTTTIKASGIPFINLQGGVYEIGSRRISGPIGIELGEIKIPETSPSLTSESADWSHNQMTFSNNLNIWVSRLSPAILIQNLNNSLRLFSGNLSGANVVESSAESAYPRVVLNRVASPSLPKYAAYSSGGTVRVQQIPASGATLLSLPALDNNWILVWYGNNSHFSDSKLPMTYGNAASSMYDYLRAYQADVPMLLKFENNPTSIRQSTEGGIDLNFGTNNSGFTSMMPLFGREHLLASDTEGWGTSGTLPANVLTKINFWNTNNRLCSYPTTVSEAYNYDTNTDTSTISENISYLNVCSGGSTTSGFAILPPALSLAKDAVRANISGTQVDASYPTEFGPIIGIDNTNTYSWSVSGLRKYTDSKRITTNPNGAPNELIQELTFQVDEATKLGHLKPWLFSDHLPRSATVGDIYFLNPAETISSLSEVIPVLPEPQKTNLINYIRTERTNYPPETVYNLPSSGNLRTPFALDNYDTWFSVNKNRFLKRVPLYNFSGLSQYYDLIKETIPGSVLTSAKTVLDNDMAEQDWATSSWFKGFGQDRAAIVNANRHLAGLIGFVKLSKSAGDTQAENLARSLLAKAAVNRIAMAKYSGYQYMANLISVPSEPDWMGRSSLIWVFVPSGYLYNYNWTGPLDDANHIVTQDQFGSYLYESSGYFAPGPINWGVGSDGYMGWFEMNNAHPILYKDLTPETFRLLADYAKQETEIYLNKYTTMFPNWFSAFAEGVIGAEKDLSNPITSFQLFMAKALLENDTPQNLEKYTDISWLDSGDFFYMQKLAETIKAYQGVKWEDELVSPTPSATPTPCTLTGATWSLSNVTSDTPVTMTVTGNNCPDQTVVNFLVRENDSILEGGLDEDASSQPSPNTAIFTNNTATLTWNAKYMQDGLNGIFDPSEFFFTATVGTQSIRSQDPLLVVTQSQATTIPSILPGSPDNWEQTFGDEFDGSSLDQTKWNTRYQWGEIIQHNERQSYTNNALQVQNGILRITGNRQVAPYDNTQMNYTSGLITSAGKFSQQYGYWEMRAKLPKGQGLWPAFWMTLEAMTRIDEVDILEAVSNDPNLYMTLHYGNNYTTDYRNTGGSYAGSDLSQGYHIFAVDWEPNLLIWYVDGVERFRTTTGVPQAPMVAQANLAIGGNWPGDPNTTTVFPSFMDIDFIRIYRQKNNTVNTPAFSPTGRIFTQATDVTLATTTPGATIRYTLDGSDPTSSSAVYSNPINLTASTTIKAKAFAPGLTDSSVATATFNIYNNTTALAAPWQESDITGSGVTLNTGSTRLSGNTYLVNGAGYTIGETILKDIDTSISKADNFHYVYRQLASNQNAVEMVIRIDNMDQTNARAGTGIMLRNNLTPTSSYVLLTQTQSLGTILQYRDGSGQIREMAKVTEASAPVWLRLVFQNGMSTAEGIFAYQKKDGDADWALVGQSPYRIVSAYPYLGIATSSGYKDTLAMSAINYVQFPGDPAQPIPTPSATPTPCTISSVSWPNGMSSVTEGSNVNISVQASGECNGKQVHLTVRRQVAFQSDVDATNQPNPRDVTLTLTGNTATASATWRSDIWTNACTLGTCNPTFFAKGNVVGETQEVTTDRNNDLVVTQSQTVPTDPNDWPQVQKDPQHTGYSNEIFNINYNLPYEQRFKVAWRRSFPQERIHPQVQTIIYQGKAYAGTENGKLYALNAGSGTNAGQIAWSFNTGSSILNSVAAYNNNIYVATLDGNIFAIDTNGQQVWKRQITQKLGFYTAPIIAENKILIGGRDGNFYAISPSDGNVMWSQSIGTPILHTAAYNNGRVFFGGMNMIVYALNTNDGGISWQSQKLNGMIFKDFYPVVTQGKVIVRPYAKYSTDGIVPGSPLVQIRGASDPNYSWLVNNATTLKNGNAASIPEFMSAQDTIMASYQANPQNYSKNIFILDENTGQESTVVPHWSYVHNIAGGGSMPCVDKDNYLVMPIGMIGQAGWGRLNLNYSTGPRIVDVLYDGTTQSTGTTWTWPDGTNNTHPYPPGFGNRDENLTVTCTQNMIFASSHSPNLGLSASYSGGYDLTARTWVHFPGGAVPFQMSNSMGGQNPLSISNGVMYHVEDNTIVARTTN